MNGIVRSGPHTYISKEKLIKLSFLLNCTMFKLQELVNNQSYNEKSDIWSLGCMLYELCALAPPFTATNEGDLKKKIRIGQFPRLPTQYSLELDMIIRRMIQVEVRITITFNLIFSALYCWLPLLLHSPIPLLYCWLDSLLFFT